ncbi:MAG: methylmalonyl Co-A mutase-associated GTPase MeaB [Chloroflexi bacterium]|nr:methylmalonyl Co-A mutase-associated GTPase MeaB [Chloroflexota bacterium]
MSSPNASPSVTDLVRDMRAGDRGALARLLTMVEEGGEAAAQVLLTVHPHAGGAQTVGVTGPPGAGKSTLVDQLARRYRSQGQTVGILAIDPSSPFSGGAFLGDRVRMQQHYLDPGVFIRSMATRGSRGGLARMAGSAVKLLDASGKDVVFVETVGVGQTELEVMGAADTVAVLLVPEGGDAIQALKAGLLEVADILVVNKADREGAGRMVTYMEAMLNMAESPSGWRPPVLQCQAHKGIGVEEVEAAIRRHREFLSASSGLAERRRLRSRREFLRAVEEALGGLLHELLGQEGELAAIAAEVEAGRLDPFVAAREAVHRGVLLRQWLQALRQGEREET